MARRVGRPDRDDATRKLDGRIAHRKSKPRTTKLYGGISDKPVARSKGSCGTPKRWAATEADHRAISDGFYFDERLAEYAANWIETKLSHTRGRWAGKPFILLPWQRDEIIYPLFGWIGKDKLRRFRRAYVEIPKKNGKSTLAAAVGVYMLAGDAAGGANVINLATGMTQASIVHDEAIHMVEASPELAGLLDINRTNKAISNIKHRLCMRAMPYTAAGLEGFDLTCLIGDEVHVWRGRAVWDSVKYASAAQQNALQFLITTAGDDLESICYKFREHAADVTAGRVEDHRLLSAIYAPAHGANPAHKKVWKKANPSMGVIFSQEDFEADYREASKSPADMSTFKRYRLNVWSTGALAWLDMEKWSAAYEPFDVESFDGQPCYVGLDLARAGDISSAVLVYRQDDTYKLVPRFWLPEKRQQELIQYLPQFDWSGVTIMPGDVANYHIIEEEIVDLIEAAEPAEIVYDKHYATEITERIEDRTGIERVEFPQTLMTFTGPCSAFERLLYQGRLLHNGDPLLNWQAGNVNVKRDPNNNIRPIKPTPNSIRSIDGVVAAIMGLSRAMANAEADLDFYESNALEMG